MVFDIDHLILVVADLDKASALYEKMGFTLTAKSVHPFGTANRLVVFGENFIELLAVDDVDKLGNYVVVPQAIEAAGGDVAWSIIWQCSDMKAIHNQCEELGLAPSALQSRLTRSVTHPDGTQQEACFSSFALTNGLTPTYCEGFSIQHVPEAAFAQEWRQHKNGAVHMPLVLADSDDLDTLTTRLQLLFSESSLSGSCVMEGDVCSVRGQSSEYQITKRNIEAKDQGPRIRRAVILVSDIAKCEQLFKNNGVSFQKGENELEVSASHACGINLLFRQAETRNDRSFE
ncbi:VOC family protein [Pseudomaricurvus alkylphenolicus]|uniref:VOC family protein n=1 Tax=Pseudomaricurvus alkylphenolicus TaxID=1306991 RepID=UPI001420BE0B|nr:VOC family protein [Pseudomaricurvus alkylphenolicus]NIB44908.1 VOC family protein [Pseudomaricurvus alkylphenolicus]